MFALEKCSLPRCQGDGTSISHQPCRTTREQEIFQTSILTESVSIHTMEITHQIISEQFSCCFSSRPTSAPQLQETKAHSLICASKDANVVMIALLLCLVYHRWSHDRCKTFMIHEKNERVTSSIVLSRETQRANSHFMLTPVSIDASSVICLW